MYIELEDLQYLIDMAYGYIDDDLGGMDRENSHSIRLRSIMAKYNIAITPIA